MFFEQFVGVKKNSTGWNSILGLIFDGSPHLEWFFVMNSLRRRLSARSRDPEEQKWNPWNPMFFEQLYRVKKIQNRLKLNFRSHFRWFTSSRILISSNEDAQSFGKNLIWYWVSIGVLLLWGVLYASITLNMNRGGSPGHGEQRMGHDC